jgi:hypothetical protein
MYIATLSWMMNEPVDACESLTVVPNEMDAPVNRSQFRRPVRPVTCFIYCRPQLVPIIEIDEKSEKTGDRPHNVTQ